MPNRLRAACAAVPIAAFSPTSPPTTFGPPVTWRLSETNHRGSRTPELPMKKPGCGTRLTGSASHGESVLIRRNCRIGGQIRVSRDGHPCGLPSAPEPAVDAAHLGW